ncbi:MAG: response regulator [Bacteroidales bacterium]|nr:response regulator [Bacteroidales bacterium]
MKKRFLASLFLALYTLLPLSGEGKHGFNHYNVEDGMSHSSVEAILQDRVGFMWLGTGNGLNKFDGHTFRAYGSHHVLSLLEAPNGLIWVGTTEGLVRFDSRKETFLPFAPKTPEGGAISKEVSNLRYDDEGILWIGTDSEGLFRYDPSKNILTRINALDVPKSTTVIHDILPETNEVVYLATDRGLVRYDIRWNRSVTVALPVGGGIVCLEEEDNETLLLGGRDGCILRFNKKTERTESCLEGLPPASVMRKIGKDELWIGTESGLFIYNLRSREVETVRQNLSERTGLSGNAIRSLYEDTEGGVWIGVHLGGINYTSTEQSFVTQFTPSIAPGALHAQVISEFVEGNDGRLWFGTEDDGLYSYDRTDGTFRNWNPDNSALPWHNVSALLLDGELLYIGLQTHGICTMDLKTETIRRFSPQAVDAGSILALCKDSRGNIQVGTKDGLLQFHPEDGRFTRDEAMDPGITVCDIHEDHLQRLWIATRGGGIFFYDPKSGIRSWFRKGTHEDSLPSDKTISIMSDSRRRLWIGTEDGGACRFDPSTETFERVTTENGLPNNTVYEILEDKDGNLWFSTGKGLARRSAETGSFITYSYNYGTPADQFNYKSAIKTRDGKLFFGTVRGFMEVIPEDLRTNYDPPKVVFTGWSMPGGDYTLEPAETILPGLKFKHNQGNISFRFAALTYTAPQNNRYAYRLRGLDKEWTYTKNTSIHYSRIPPGKYFLEVMGANGDGVWSKTPTSIRLVVRPPFLASLPGILLEVLALAGVLLLIYRSQRKRMQEKNRREIERFREAEALSTQKSRIEFFTSIIHEIRTPLSLIKAPFEQIRQGGLSEEEQEEDMDMIGANIDRLMLLSNEILDFSKIEVNAFHLRPRVTRVDQIAEEVIRNFSYAIKERGILIEKALPEGETNARIDPEILIKILTNLLANATKYAEKRIRFRMEENGKSIRFRISNDGPLIGADDRERIFHPFFREDRDGLITGTGLGLPLVRKLAELHHGEVHVDEQDTDWNTLVVEIPELEDTEANLQEESTLQEIADPDPVKRTIAIVDDDVLICQYLRRNLSKEYNVLICTGAKELFETLQENMVDLIVSDIMMPGTDGIQLCRDLKASFEYSHIPVILLSAKVDRDVKMEGLNAEADAFIEKPFTIDYLERQVRNVFSRLDRMRDYYTRNPGVEDVSLQGSPSDRAFMERITAIILEHMSEEDFSIDRIADIVGMSRSTLYRKIRGVTQIPPNELIKIVRLKRAAEMLRSGAYRVNEAAFLVGFSSVSYFSTCFHKQFGQSPKEYMYRGQAGSPPA